MSRTVSCPSGTAWRVFMYPPRDGETSLEFGQMQEDWDDFTEDLRYVLREKFPSLSDCKKWLGREDQAILENTHAQIGISEYNGIVCVWCVPKDRSTSASWCAQIEDSARKHMTKRYPDSILIFRGCASNGEGMFALASKPGSCVTSKEGRLW